jgi:heat shock protein HtpX
MNITASSFTTRIRTWLLIAGLTALLLVIGAAIGGGAFYLFAAFAVAMNPVGYWFSDRFALKASRAKPIEPGAIPWLEAVPRGWPRAPACRRRGST